jgi:DNA replicative helicase MCM subunit Mcm2 (Cdc46/Mcm family)
MKKIDLNIILFVVYRTSHEMESIALPRNEEHSTCVNTRGTANCRMQSKKKKIDASTNRKPNIISPRMRLHSVATTCRKQPGSLLSRFDLLFIVLDQMDPQLDRRISEHVVKSHQYRRPGTVMEPEPMHQASRIDLEEHSMNDVETHVWTRGGKKALTISSGGRKPVEDTLTKDFLRKYVHYAKSKELPDITDDASHAIENEFAQMRSKNSSKNLPITARTLETVIRLSTACAKSRLSKMVEVQDVEVAMQLLNFVLFHEFGEVEGDNSTGDDADTDNELNIAAGRASSSSSSSAANLNNNNNKRKSRDGEDNEDTMTSDEDLEDSAAFGKRTRASNNDDTHMMEDEESNDYGHGSYSSSSSSNPSKQSSRYMRLIAIIAQMTAEDDFDSTLEVAPP